MTDKEIRQLARERLTENSDIVIISIIYFFSTIALIYFFETFITAVIRLFADSDYQLYKSLFDGVSFSEIMMLILRITMYYLMVTLIRNILLRYFINMNEGCEAERFISVHWSRLLNPCLRGSFKLLLYKTLVTLPLFFGIYGINYFRNKGLSSQLTLLDLVCFMLCIGFSIVWVGELIHYFISLSLVQYIIAINPRANFFDACDLSVKLMDGKHSRVITFWMQTLPMLLLPCILVYPVLLVCPYIVECKLIFAREVMGDYWQDKIPSMARRWERQQARLKRRSSV